MSMLEVWLLFVVVPGLGCIGGVLIALSIIASVVFSGIAMLHFEALPESVYRIGECFDNTDSKKKINQELRSRLGKALICGLIGATLTVTCPNKKEVAALVLVPYMTNNPEFKKLPENLAKHLNELLEDYLPTKTAGVNNNE